MKQRNRRKLASGVIILLMMQHLALSAQPWGMKVLAETRTDAGTTAQEPMASGADWSTEEKPAASGAGWSTGQEPVASGADWSMEKEPVAATIANAVVRGSILTASLQPGDFWENWNGICDFPGEGTEDAPYRITGIGSLMGLSQAVASGEDFDDTYFVLTQDIDLGDLNVNSGNWNPIGWYQNESECSADVIHTFRGHFEGGGNTISGLKIVDPSRTLKNIGLFGVIDGGSVRNLTVEAEELVGEANVAVLAGAIRGDAVIADVTVSGMVRSAANAGGIAGEAVGGAGPAVLENCRAEGIVVYSSGTESYVGGIVGDLQDACLVDSTAITQDGDYNRIYGKGYVGGIVGRMKKAQLYNVYVNGTVGGNGSRAAGGIVGKYESGNLILARMAGDIARTNLGSASREGTFVGTRESQHHFTYGTERTSNLAYLYTNSAAKARRVFGSTIDGDNTYTRAAHIGYWTDLERKYVTVAGGTEQSCGERYFYEELEDAVRYIVTQKLNREFTAQGYGKGLAFRLDHFAPGYMGEPVRGHLVSVPRIDARNDNGTVDTDVAVLSAVPSANSYYRTIDKDHPAAVAPGLAVAVLTAPRSTEMERYQMVVDETQAGGAKPPVYLNEQGEFVPMQYVKTGSYSFVMPDCDTELNAEYCKVTTRVAVTPAETVIAVTHTRTGDRRNPDTVTEVRNGDGVLIARYIAGELDRQVEVQPVRLHAVSNGTGTTADQSVRWSLDDTDLLVNRSEAGYTRKDAQILPNMDSAFIQGILAQELQAQADQGYRSAINPTVYTRSAVVTATSNPDTSADHQEVSGNCRVNVTFQILDYTTVRVNGMCLNQSDLLYTITRKLTGLRQNPTETYQVTEPVLLTATLMPDQPFYKNVFWSDRENGKILVLTPSGDHTQDCLVSVHYDPAGTGHPAWIQNIIQADKEKLKNDPTARQDGSGTYQETVTAFSEDQTNGHIAASCRVTIRFETVDETTTRYIAGSGGSGGGGGSSSGGSSGGSVVTAGMAGPGVSSDRMPDYVVQGTWSRHEDGSWTFANETRSFSGEWAAVWNPYADPSKGQSAFDWFRFDGAGHMVTGWFTDVDGLMYYLNPQSDGTKGRMLTGWNWIDGYCYYFQENSDGKRGALYRNGTTPDGFTVNETGAWMVDGAIQTIPEPEGGRTVG